MVIAGLERIDAGRVVVAGQDYSGLDEDRLARFRGREIGFVFQAFHLMQTMTALENVAVPLELAGRADAFQRAERGARPGRSRRAAVALSGAALRRRAAARGDRAGARDRAGDPDRRRADRQSRRRDRTARSPTFSSRRSPSAAPRSSSSPTTSSLRRAATGRSGSPPGRSRRTRRRFARPPRGHERREPCRSRSGSRFASCAADSPASTSSSPASRSALRRSPA